MTSENEAQFNFFLFHGKVRLPSTDIQIFIFHQLGKF